MQARGMAIGLLLLALLMFTSSVFAKMYSQTLCKFPGFHCVRVKHGQSWTSLFPDDHDRDIIMRINRMNTQLYPGLKIAVPNHVADTDIMDYAPFPKQIEAPDEKVIVVDPVTYAWGAYGADGALVRWGPISAGADYCRDIDEPCHTHEGSFRIFSLGSSGCISHKFPLPYGGAPMPYCMYFNNGQALHGEPNGLPGYNASHGCVRLYVNDAEWLRYDFVEDPNADNNYRGTRVIVKAYEDDEYDKYDNHDEHDSEARHENYDDHEINW